MKKIAIYTICKNEESNIRRFMESTEGVPVYVLDTGSTDKTVELLKECGAIVEQKIVYPWRFDVARNVALDMVPDEIDICVSVDMDEVLESGWSEKLQKEWKGNIGSYQYVSEWSDKEKTKPAVVGPRTKVHSRHDYTWEKPIHEMLVIKPGIIEKHCDLSFQVRHYRSNRMREYIPLLTQFLRENPQDTNAWLQRASEYFLLGEYKSALSDYKTFLHLTHENENPTIRHKKSLACTAIAQCYYQLGDANSVMRYYLRALAEHPETKEPWIHLGQIFDSLRNPAMAYGFAAVGYNIKEQPAYVVRDLSANDELAEDIIRRNYDMMKSILENNENANTH